MKLVFVGDFCSTPSPGLITVAEDLKELLRGAEVGVCNFEVPVKSGGKAINKIPLVLYQSVEAPRFLEGLGFNVVSLANNHMFDYGREGFYKTRDSFSKETVVMGAGTFDEAYRVHVVERNGVKVGFLAVVFACSGVLSGEAGGDEPGCAAINHLRVNHLIVEARKEVDFLFVYPHDGIEYVGIPLPEIRARYRDFIDWGADGVIAHHPHVPQGWELYKEKPIFYSLGNFFFNSKQTPDYRAKTDYWYNGLLVEMVVGVQPERVMQFKVHHVLNEGNVRLGLDDSEAIQRHVQGLCDVLQQDETYAKLLKQEITRLWENKYSPTLDWSFLSASTKHGYKSSFKNCIKGLLGRDGDMKDFYAFLKNDSDRNLMIRYLRKMYNYK